MGGADSKVLINVGPRHGFATAAAALSCACVRNVGKTKWDGKAMTSLPNDPRVSEPPQALLRLRVSAPSTTTPEPAGSVEGGTFPLNVMV